MLGATDSSGALGYNPGLDRGPSKLGFTTTSDTVCLTAITYKLLTVACSMGRGCDRNEMSVLAYKPLTVWG